MKELLWSFEDVKHFTHHPEGALRSWAVDRLIKRYPDQAGDILVTLVDERRQFISSRVLDFLAETREAEKYGPPLLESLKQAQGEHFGRIASALARLNYRLALPTIVQYIEETDQPIDRQHFWSLIQALGEFGSDEARQTLWKLLEQESPAGEAATALIEALLNAAKPEDVPRLLHHYRTLTLNKGPFRSFGFDRHPLMAFATSVEAGRLTEEMSRQFTAGFWAMLETAEWWLNVSELPLSEAGLDALEEAFDRLALGVPQILLREFNRLIDARNDNIEAWRLAWEAGERPAGYRRRVLYTQAILQTLAELPKATRTPREQESTLGLALLAQVSAGQDDEGRLETAEDKTETLLSILDASRQIVLPDIAERVAALGPDVVPRLVEMLDPDDFGWTSIRVCEAIERLARQHPESCAAAVPKLIACLHDEQGDYLEEAASAALEAIGPPAVPQIIKQLRTTKDMSRQIYLTGTLSEIPVEGAEQVVLDKLQAGESIEEGELMLLSDIGSPTAIDPLYQIWQASEKKDPILAERLLILCELNQVDKPELAEWRKIVEAEDKRFAKVLAEDEFELPDDEVEIMARLKKLSESPRSLIRTWQLPQKQNSDSARNKQKKKKRR